MDTKAISEKIQSFLEREGFDVRVGCDTDFVYEYATSTVYYALVVSDNSSKWFREYALSKGLKYDCGSFFLSLFHELGHHMTMDLIDDDEYWEGVEKKKGLDGSKKEDNFFYFDLPDERAATEWAIDYINNNQEKIQELYNSIKLDIDQIFKMVA
jgi:hypothetical protein